MKINSPDSKKNNTSIYYTTGQKFLMRLKEVSHAHKVCFFFLKLQSVSFASLSPSMFENLELQLLAELSSLRGVVSRHGCSADESNVLKSMCGSQSPHWCGCLLYFAITDSSLRLGIYDPNKNFHRILSSEQVSNKPGTFVLTNWGKKHCNKSRYQWWLNLTIS